MLYLSKDKYKYLCAIILFMRNYRRRTSFVNCAMRVIEGDKIAEPLCDYMAIQDFGNFSDEEMEWLVSKMVDPK